LLTGVLRLGVVALAIMLLLAPFGAGPSEWLHRLDHVRATGLSIGEVQLRPMALLQSVVVLLMGFGIVRLLQRWLSASYLPTTSLDPGMRLSAATLFGYAGYVLAVALSLSAIGIGLERVAWIASALSVGIGFGLQAVVQNFVSGLILLAERPVKVGDWVTLGTVEGDIRRINVRATEIQMSDRSTVIVPNSEFITKVVRNVTHDYPLGRVQIKMTLPLSSDPEHVRELMLSAFMDHPDIQAEPRPSVLLDDVTVDGLIFNATAYVNSPRAVYGVRSALLFDILARLKVAAHPLVAAGSATPELPVGPALSATSAAAPP
jgi:small-conductance mechanosensitive channel